MARRIEVADNGRRHGLLQVARYALRLAADPGGMPGPDVDAVRARSRRIDAMGLDELRALALQTEGQPASIARRALDELAT